MKNREVAAMSKLQNNYLTLWKEVNKTITHGKHFQMICQKVHTMIQPSQNFQFILDQVFSFELGCYIGSIRAISSPPSRQTSNRRRPAGPLHYFNLLTRGPSTARLLNAEGPKFGPLCI